jgi:two-component system cell cycle sensor histidine kinase/response regulator CckA
VARPLPVSGIPGAVVVGDPWRVAASVLVVDDQDVVRDVMKLALESAGYDVLTAASPIDALDVVRDASIDLLITDVVMPEMDAFELADEVVRKLPDIRVLYTSGYTDASPEGPFIQKPFTPSQLIATVGALLAS